MASDTSMTPAQARATYDGHAETYHITYGCYRPEVGQLIGEANLTTSDIVLDLGTGPGWAAHAAAQQCCLAIGLDISPNMIGRARRDHATYNQSKGTDHLARFEVANMQSHTSIQAAVTRILQESDLRARLQQNGIEVSGSTPLRFQVVLMHMSFSHIALELRVPFLKMVKQHLLADGGRVVIAHDASRCDMYSVQEQYLYHPDGNLGRYVLGYFGRSRLGGNASEKWTRDEIRKLALEAGLKLTRSMVKNKHPQYGFKDLTQEVRAIAIRKSGQSEPGFEALEHARMELHDTIGTAFEVNADAPKEGQMYEGHRVVGLKHNTRHGVVSVVATLQSD